MRWIQFDLPGIARLFFFGSMAQDCLALGQLWVQNGQIERGLKSFELGIQKDSENASLYYHYANALMKVVPRPLPDRLIPLYQKCIALNELPILPGAHTNLAGGYRKEIHRN